MAGFHAGALPRPKGQQAAIEEALTEARYRLQALRIEPSTKATVDSMAKLTAVVDRLSERLYGSVDTALPKVFRQFYDLVKMTPKDPGLTPIDRLVTTGSYTGDGRDDAVEHATGG